MTITKYCVMRIKGGDILYFGQHIKKACEVWNPGTVMGRGSQVAEAVVDAFDQREKFFPKHENEHTHPDIL